MADVVLNREDVRNPSSELWSTYRFQDPGDI